MKGEQEVILDDRGVVASQGGGMRRGGQLQELEGSTTVLSAEKGYAT
jgi:hypothetical protein